MCTVNELEQELQKTRLTVKKLERELKQANTLIERNRVTFVAKDNLSHIVSQKKSELEMYMNLLLENCPDIILIFDQAGNLIYCTNVFLKATNTAAFGLVAGTSFRDIFTRYAAKDLLARAEDIYQDQETKPSPSSVYMTDSIDFDGGGNFRHYSIQITPLTGEKGRNMGTIVIFYDTSELLKAQREAEKANKAKSDFLATVSHEIRTPMNAIIGISNMLRSTELSAEQQTFVKNIQSSSNVLLTLINDILDFSKIEAGKLELVSEYFSLPALLERLKTMFELLFAEKDLSFRCCFADNLPLAVLGDEKRIGQIISNLLSNALKYTRTGGVNFKTAVDGEEIVIEVEDTGIGIKEDSVSKLFTAFEQLDLVRNKQVQGTGLGLAITKKLCEMMGGSIKVHSEYNKGSVFTIRLHLKEGTVLDLPEEKKPVEAFTAPDAQVLLVDDIDINLEVAAFVLYTYGITADLAKSGREALEKAQAKPYDLILMDHMMPEMDGVEATRAIRAGGYNAKTPIIALTANAVNEARTMFLANGFNELLPKPMESSVLAEVLLRWLPDKLIKK